MPRGTDKTGRAGEHYVAAELNRGGAYASPFSGNVPGIDIVATNAARNRMVYIQVKTKHEGGNWQIGLNTGWLDIMPSNCAEDGSCDKDCTPKLQSPIQGKKDHYWVFVSLLKEGGQRYWIVPDDDVRNQLVRKRHLAYLAKHGGQRPGPKHNSLHHSFSDKELQEWSAGWDLLDLGLVSGA